VVGQPEVVVGAHDDDLTAVIEEDFAMAAQLRDEIRALENLKTVGTPEHSISEMEVTYLLDDLMV
jgi:hypothetical protein